MSLVKFCFVTLLFSVLCWSCNDDDGFVGSTFILENEVLTGCPNSDFNRTSDFDSNGCDDDKICTSISIVTDLSGHFNIFLPNLGEVRTNFSYTLESDVFQLCITDLQGESTCTDGRLDGNRLMLFGTDENGCDFSTTYRKR